MKRFQTGSPKELCIQFPDESSRPEFTPLSELDEMISRGWGDTPQLRIPKNWRDRYGKPDSYTTTAKSRPAE